MTLIFLLSVIFFQLSLHGATYYISPNGSDDNQGTITQPWQTIQQAAVTLAAGDTVYIMAGIYKERLIPQNSGNPGNYTSTKVVLGFSPLFKCHSCECRNLFFNR